ncbi:nucleotide-binding protein [Thermogymnomonas acidicola]|uniref:nucleotide-binding protein n=1 Tax=Thermogymnomonas acidicola TaxID=399579 RepID=UPI0009463E1B|nr:nucleotide-binding protein [Thermogymnomonas acidicola]
MSAKHHCIICGTLIYSGLYCSTCNAEVTRSRTLDEESLEEWISRKRDERLRVSRHGSEGGEIPLEDFA